MPKDSHNEDESARGNGPVTSSPIRDSEEIDALAEMVREVVAAYRMRGQKGEEAMEHAGGDLGIAPRRVEMFKDREVYSVKRIEAEGIRNGHYEAMKALMAWHMQRAGQLRRRLAEMDRCDFGPDRGWTNLMKASQS